MILNLKSQIVFLHVPSAFMENVNRPAQSTSSRFNYFFRRSARAFATISLTPAKSVGA
jgi:hypothetical protein